MAHKKINLALGTDHRGYELKEYLLTQHEVGDYMITWHDVGAYSSERSDYPDFAHKAVALMLAKQVDGAVLMCGNGVGMSIAANRYRGIYAGLAWNPAVARSCKEDDNCSILVLPADYVIDIEAYACLDAWLHGVFKGGRYQERLQAVDAVAGEYYNE